MLLEKDQKHKIATLWMTAEEHWLHKELLSDAYARLNDEGYKPIVFISGRRDLSDATADLLALQKKH